MNVDSSDHASITTTPTGMPSSTLRSTSASTRAWVFHSLPLIHGRKTHAAGSLGAADLVEVGGEHRRRRAVVQPHFEARFVRCHGDLDGEAVSDGVADVEPRAPRRAHVEAPAFAAGDDGERGREICAGALLLVLLEHDAIEGAAPLVEGVEALAEADDVLVGVETEGEARPHRSVGGDQPLDRFRDEPIDVAVGGQLAALRCPTPGQHREPLGRTGDEVGAPAKR